ncbi:hypothetical protein [Roseibium sp.]|uniref:hypothetical protein n=1 Tax=Roseibium sp. TaxID=1936156 RepID=UPI003A98656E
MTTFLAACQGTPVPTQTQPSYLDQVRLAQVDIDFSNAERPLLVDDLNSDINETLSGGSTLASLGTRFGVINGAAKQAALENAIAANVRPHVEDALNPLLTGTRPVRAVVDIRSVFVRSRLSLQQLTGAHAYVNGKKRPDNAQFIAGLTLVDMETGMPIQQVEPITRIDDGAITIAGGGPKAPGYGKAGRLNQLIFDFARAAANALQRNASSEDFSIDASEGDARTLWESRTAF